MCSRADKAVADREAYVVMRDHRLLQKPRERAAELDQAARLFELLPQQPNDPWQTDVTYIRIPGHGWWYAVTVIKRLIRAVRGILSQNWAEAFHWNPTPRQFLAKPVVSRNTPYRMN